MKFTVERLTLVKLLLQLTEHYTHLDAEQKQEAINAQMDICFSGDPVDEEEQKSAGGDAP